MCRRASRSSWTSIWPLSSSSKAAKAERSSDEGDKGVRRDDKVERKVARGSEGEVPDGKKGWRKGGEEGRPEKSMLLIGSGGGRKM